MRHILTLTVATLLAAPVAAAAMYPEEGGTLRFYGSEAEPCVEIELCGLESNSAGESSGAENGPCSLAVRFLAPDRARVAVESGWSSADSFFVQRSAESGFVLSGRLAIEDKVHLVRAVLSSDRRKLEWVAPEKVTLSGGRTFQMAGEYGEQGNETRNAAGKAAYEKIDRELNAVYAEVKGKLHEGVFELVRKNQREWLRYRDRPYEANYDGDYQQNGPGSATHYRRMSGDTGARIEYLKSFLERRAEADSLDGLYSDGLDRTIRVRFLGDLMSFTLALEYQKLHVEELFEWHGSITGCARTGKVTDGIWTVNAGAMSGRDQETVIPDELQFLFLPDGVVEVNLPAADDAEGQAGALYGGRFRRLRALQPAEDSLRHWLTLLPEEAFEGTTDPLTRPDAVDLARTGSGGQGFTIAEDRWNRLVLRHPDGDAALARFARKDGGLVLGVEQTNGRNLKLDFWEWDAVAQSFRPWDHRPVAPDPEEFFRYPLTDAEALAVEEYCRVRRVLMREDYWNGVEIFLVPGMGYEGRQPDYDVSLEWDGYRLGGFLKLDAR